MHIAICRLLEPFGYYAFDYFDDDGWPHYTVLEQLPLLKGRRTECANERSHCSIFFREKSDCLICTIISVILRLTKCVCAMIDKIKEHIAKVEAFQCQK